MQFRTSRTVAEDLMEDDKFKMGGEMYQISKVDTNVYKEKVITFFPIANDVLGGTLIVPAKTKFKIYNQR